MVSRSGWRLLSLEVSNAKHELISRHDSVMRPGVLPYFRRLEKHPGSSILRSNSTFHPPVGTKIS